MIIGLAGYARSGKDTLASMMVSNYDFKQIAYADALKNILKATNPLLDEDGMRLNEALSYFGEDDLKSSKYGGEYRRLCQKLGTEGIRKNIGESTWINVVKDSISADPESDWVVTDCRFANEIQAVKDLGGQVLWVHRPGVDPVNSHSSDNSISERDADEIIYNMGTKADMLSQFIQWRDLNSVPV